MADARHGPQQEWPPSRSGERLTSRPQHSGRARVHHAASPSRHGGAQTRSGPTGARHSIGDPPTVSTRLAQRPARPRTRRPDASPWNWLLLVPIVLPLMPWLYNRIEPTLFGIPFFYWCQLGFAFLASAVITVVHLKAR